MKKTLIILNLLTVGVMLLFATGCGGGNESAGGQSTTAETKDASESVGTIDTTVTASPRSKSEFLQLANGLCRRATANQLTEVLQYAKEHEDEGLPEAELGVKAYRNAVAPKLPARIEEIRALGAPKGYEKQVETVLDSIVRVLNAPDRSMFRELHRSSKVALRYGLGQCSA